MIALFVGESSNQLSFLIEGICKFSEDFSAISLFLLFGVLVEEVDFVLDCDAEHFSVDFVYFGGRRGRGCFGQFDGVGLCVLGVQTFYFPLAVGFVDELALPDLLPVEVSAHY